MNRGLGYSDNGNYYLTLEGQKELFEEINRRKFYNKSQSYEDYRFSSIIEFITRNINNTIDVALSENVKPNSIPLDRHLRISENRKKLEAYLGSIATACGKEDLSGEDILSYFCSEEYQQGIATHGFVSTIDGISEVLIRNIGLENEEFLDKIQSINSRPIKK